MRKLLGVVLAVAVVVAALSLFGGTREAPSAVDRPAAARVTAKEPRAERALQPGETRADARARWIREQADARAKMVERIAEATAARQRRAAAAPDGEAVAERAVAPAAVPGEEGAAGPGLVDRSGTRGYLVRVMNEDLIPLADECYELAKVDKPELAGLLEFELAIVGDEEVGGVVEAAEPGHGNGIADVGLIECVRESLMATTLPPPPSGGRDEIMLSLRFGPDE